MIKRYKDLFQKNIDLSVGIPKNIFRTSKYKIDELPKEIIDIYKEDMINNPAYTLYYFDDDDCLEFIEDLGDKRLLDAYNKLIPTAFKADLWRYCILNKYGGVYSDYAHRAIVSYDEIIGYDDEIYVKDYEDENFGSCIYNAFICTIPNSKILKRAIEICLFKIENEQYGTNSLDVTACKTLASAYNLCNNNIEDKKIEINNIIKYYNDYSKIVDIEGNTIIKCRDIKEYYNKTYNFNNENIKPNTHYSELWKNKILYKDERWLSIEKLYKEILKRKADLNGIYGHYISKGSIENIKTTMIDSEEYKTIKNNQKESKIISKHLKKDYYEPTGDKEIKLKIKHFIFHVNNIHLTLNAYNAVKNNIELINNIYIIDNSETKELNNHILGFENCKIIHANQPLSTAQSMNWMREISILENIDIVSWQHNDAEPIGKTVKKSYEIAQHYIMNNHKFGAIMTNYDTFVVFSVEALKNVGKWDWISFPFYYLDWDYYCRLNYNGYKIIQSYLPCNHNNNCSNTIKTDSNRWKQAEFINPATKMLFDYKLNNLNIDFLNYDLNPK